MTLKRRFKGMVEGTGWVRSKLDPGQLSRHATKKGLVFAGGVFATHRTANVLISRVGYDLAYFERCPLPFVRRSNKAWATRRLTELWKMDEATLISMMSRKHG